MHSSWLSSLLHLHAVTEIEGIIRNNCFDFSHFSDLQDSLSKYRNIQTQKYSIFMHKHAHANKHQKKKNPSIIRNNVKTKFNYCCTECRLHFQCSCVSSISEKNGILLHSFWMPKNLHWSRNQSLINIAVHSVMEEARYIFLYEASTLNCLRTSFTTDLSFDIAEWYSWGFTQE